MNTQTIEQRIATLEAQVFKKVIDVRAAPDKDQNLLADGWIRHVGNDCPVHPKTRVLWITEFHNLTPHILLDKSADLLLWVKSENTPSSKITHYKITQEYVEPTTFDIVVDGVIYRLNKPYMAAPALGTDYWAINLWGGEIHKTTYTIHKMDNCALKNHACWKTKEDAEAYLRVKKMRDDFEIGVIE